MSVTMPWKASGDTPVNGVASKIDEVRHALGKEAERLADIAAKYSHEASVHAEDVADDASEQASKIASSASEKAQAIASDPGAHVSSWANDLMKAAASIGTALALSGRKTADDLNASAKTAAKELRNVRITTEPKKTGPDFLPGITLLAGFGTGIALMYFLDPERGRARRNMLRDKLMSWTRKASQTAQGTAKDLSNRAQGAMHETRKQIQGQMDQATDATSDTQTWETTSYGSATGFGSTEPATTDPSTTDTWGEQPQPTSSNSTF